MFSKRIQAQIDLFDKIKTIADIGCDHGLFCIAALQANKAERAIASDISDLSLNKARYYSKKYGVEDQMELRVGDGLCVLQVGEVDLINIAGMGGVTIADILFSGNDKLTDTLLLTPNSCEEELRRCLERLNYVCVRETIVFENNRFYQIMLCKRGSIDKPPTDIEREFGRMNMAQRTDVFLALVQKKLRDAQKMLAISSSGTSEKAMLAKERSIQRIQEYERILNP